MQEICGCDSNSAFTTVPSAAGTPLFMFFEKKMKTKYNAKFRWSIAENAVVLCQNFEIEGKIHFVVALVVSLATSVGSDL